MDKIAHGPEDRPPKLIAPAAGLGQLFSAPIPAAIFAPDIVSGGAAMSNHATSSLRRSVFVRYAIAVVTGVGAVLVTRALRTISPHAPADLIYCAAILSAWFGGTGPGLLAASISSAAIALRFIPPPYANGSITSDVIRLVIISAGVFVVSWISGRQRHAETLLQQARDELEEKVQDRTAELRRINEELQAEIVERKCAEEALQTMQAELAHVSRVTMMGELTASIAHEVNQPLGAIMNYANACRRLLAGQPEEKAGIDAALAKIVEDAQRASDVITRIRALARKQPTGKTSLAPADLITGVVAIANYEMRARGVVLRVDLGANLPAIVADRIQLQQVLLNLIINGSEAMEGRPLPQRIIEISARSGESEGEPALQLCVRDHGTGVNPADENRLFAPFYSTKSQGLGLGLAISRSLIEGHGGRLALVPTEGPGATLQILLPVGEKASP
ncbi:MAG: His Kinase (Phospho-acceptor) protein [Lacunisphaera sp.]|nr:His Kinase (Phospho-acceptor) protein [Lacunisphaera sp.]